MGSDRQEPPNPQHTDVSSLGGQRPDRRRHQTGKGLWRAASAGGGWEEGEPSSEDSPKLGPDARSHFEQARVPIFCISDTLASGALPTSGHLPLHRQVTSDSTDWPRGQLSDANQPTQSPHLPSRALALQP